MTGHLFYFVKPLVPRASQIALRRLRAQHQMKKYSDIWPIDQRAATLPPGWPGWPDGKKFALVLQHDVDTLQGHDRVRHLMAIEEELGVRSTFFIVPKRYPVSKELLKEISARGFGLGVHGLKHDGKLFRSHNIFQKKATEVNAYLRAWNTRGFSSPSMHHQLDWMHHLHIDYSTSTFDTDPFEPQPDGACTIFPFAVHHVPKQHVFVELPYTLVQDFTLFVILKKKDIELWTRKLAWIAGAGGMALLNTHPDYMYFGHGGKPGREEYPVDLYREFILHAKSTYENEYWNPLHSEVAEYIRTREKGIAMTTRKKKTVWIDLDNSPHVPFFKPIIQELQKRGYPVTITIRDCSQTQQLADLHAVPYTKIGKHYGKNKIVKVLGTLFRATQLLPHAMKAKPALAVSHGSRALLLASKIMGIPSLGIGDYEHAQGFFLSEWLMVPEVIPRNIFPLPPERIFTYPGIKEDVYVPRFIPDPAILTELGIPKGHFLTVIRPPAVAAHYHNPEADVLFDTAVKYLAHKGNVTMIVLPRYASQSHEIMSKYPALVASRQIIIPKRAHDGLNLMWFSDFVISGGGTMNREAAALGVPVYSIFRGKIGAVDRFLSKEGRLVLLEKPEDIKTKLKVVKRTIPASPARAEDKTLDSIVGTIVKLIEKTG